MFLNIFCHFSKRIIDHFAIFPNECLNFIIKREAIAFNFIHIGNDDEGMRINRRTEFNKIWILAFINDW